MSKNQIQEVINRNRIISHFLPLGFNAYIPVYDAGVDFILYRETDNKLYKVQLKSRWTICQKYLNRNIHIAFPYESEWYLMPHDDMVKMADELGYTKTFSWLESKEKWYCIGKLSKDLLSRCQPFVIREKHAI